MDKEVKRTASSKNCVSECSGKRTGEGEERKIAIKCRLRKGSPNRCGELQSKNYQEVERKLEDH